VYSKKKSTFAKIFDKENMRGYQMVIYGYVFSSMVFFFVQTKSKYWIDQINIKNKNEEAQSKKPSNIILENGQLLKSEKNDVFDKAPN